MSESPKSRRRWFQFSIRTLLLIMVLASIGMSWIAVQMQKARRQKEAVKALEMGGARVEYEDPLHPVFRRVIGRGLFAEVFAVDASSIHNFSDEDLAPLAAFPSLKALALADTRITDAGMKHLERLTDLTYLVLSFTDVTDTGLEHIKDLRGLRTLVLARTRVTDEGVAKLQQALPNCRVVR